LATFFAQGDSHLPVVDKNTHKKQKQKQPKTHGNGQVHDHWCPNKEPFSCALVAMSRLAVRWLL
jgi:hypothetical protein